MKRAILLAVFALVLAVGCPAAMAWNSVGHMAVAYVAYQKLTPAEKARVSVLLQLNPYYKEWLSYLPAGTSDADRDMYVFMMAATWPDEIKARDSGYAGTDTPPKDEPPALNDGYDARQAHKYWHYVDTPLRADNAVLPPLQVPTITQKIGAFRADLATAEPDALKSYDLVWLLHMVGDIHQPLHCVTRVSAAQPDGDRGGNLVLLEGSPGNLHAYWDDVLGEGSTKDFAKAVKAALALPRPNRALAADSNQDDWAAEGLAIARKDVYARPIAAAPGPYTLTSSYSRRAKRIASQRVALAGARLAALVKTSLACGGQTCAH